MVKAEFEKYWHLNAVSVAEFGRWCIDGALSYCHHFTDPGSSAGLHRCCRRNRCLRRTAMMQRCSDDDHRDTARRRDHTGAAAEQLEHTAAKQQQVHSHSRNKNTPCLKINCRLFNLLKLEENLNRCS